MLRKVSDENLSALQGLVPQKPGTRWPEMQAAAGTSFNYQVDHLTAQATGTITGGVPTGTGGLDG